MTRMFTGSRSSGEGSNTNPLFDKYKKRSAKETFMNKLRGIDDSKLTPEELYKKNLDKKINEMRAEAMGNSKYKFCLPGTEGGEERGLSKTAEEFIRRMAEKKLKEEMKKEREKQQIQVKPRMFTGMQGGRIDAKGRIYGPDNRWCGSVNLKTGKVTTRSGTRICKYDPKSPYTEYLITQHIAREYNPNKGTLYGTNGHGGGMGGGIHGSGPGVGGGGGMGGFYGSGPSGGGGGGMGGFYGGGNDDKGGGFWG